jgi:hypothetical protein
MNEGRGVKSPAHPYREQEMNIKELRASGLVMLA